MLPGFTHRPCRPPGARLIMLVLCAGIGTAHAQFIDTPNTLYRIAGGSSGTQNGTGTAAQFNQPTGVIKNRDGNLYAVDTGNNTIRQITPSGVVSTFAGIAGPCGSTDTSASTVGRFCEPHDITTDGAGNLYVADAGNHTIRKITTPGGVVSTIAGTAGQTGTADLSGADARFNYPQGITINAAGYLYVADSRNNTIRQIAPGGLVSTFAGTAGQAGIVDDQGTKAQFNSPYGIITDAAGNLYVVDTANNIIRKIMPDGLVSTFAGNTTQPGAADGQGTAARFSAPRGITIDAGGNLYVADWENSSIRKITPGRYVSTVVGGGILGGGQEILGPLPGAMNFPSGVTVIGDKQLAITTEQNDVLGANFGYTFSGFLQPVDNPPTINLVKAGSAVPVKFSLGGNQGLAIFAQGYPASEKMDCSSSASTDEIEQTVNAGSSILAYDATADQYIYTWKTDKAWVGQCRTLTLRLNDGTDHSAVFELHR